MSAAEHLPRLWSEADAAEYLGVSEITLARYRKAGKIAWVRIAGSPRYTDAHLRAFLETHECPATASPTSSPSSSGPGPRSGISSGGSAGRSNGVLQALTTLGKPEPEPGS